MSLHYINGSKSGNCGIKNLLLSVILMLVVVLILSSWGCGKGGSTSSHRGEINTGTNVEIALSSVSPSGGSVTVSKPGDPLDGLKIEVPEGAYKEARTFKISYEPVVSHNFGPDFNPISPIIYIDNGGGYADQVMQLTIPVKVNPGEFAMAFFYDDNNGELEGAPLVGANNNSITIATKHFSNLVVSSILESLLAEADSKFKPGVNDWEVPNTSTIIEPKGNCAGQCITAMWYYSEKYLKDPQNTPSLFNHYDNNGGPKTPDLWQDDSLALRLVSMVQHDCVWNSYSGWALTFWGNQVTDLVTWNEIAYNMRLTGKPQLLRVCEIGPDGTSLHAHALIAYKTIANQVLVTDPNFPGQANHIDYKDGEFQPYSSGTTAEEITKGNRVVYNRVYFMPPWAFISKDQVATRWSEFEAGTIGKGKDLFPEYILKVKVQKDFLGQQVWETQDLVDGWVTDKQNVKLEAWAVDSNGQTMNSPELVVAPYLGNTLIKPNADGSDSLKPGQNHLGLDIGEFNKYTNTYSWVDFKWLDVTSGTAVSTPSPQKGQLQQYREYWINSKQVRWEYSYYTKTENGETNQVMDGVENKYWKDGTIIYQANWKDGFKVGAYEEWFASGQISVQGQFDDHGLQQGTWTYYYETGKVLWVRTFKDGKMISEVSP